MNNVSESASIQTNRDTALDFVKGFLVEIMVIYHILNYFLSIRPSVLLYINFVTGSFVFITGYLISSIYSKKYKNDLQKQFFRLFFRGGKLLSIFLMINIAIYSMALTNYNGYKFKITELFSNIGSIFLAGSAKISAFELLVPIAYTLIASSLLVVIKKQTLVISFTITLLLCASFFINQDTFFNLYYICIGLSGVAIGFFAKHIRLYSVTIWARVLSIVPVITYYLLIHTWVRENILFYFFGIISVLFCIYSFASLLTSKNFLVNIFDLFGKYTLICYLSQILFLQLLNRSIGGTGPTAILLCVAFITTNLFLYVLCLLIKRLCFTNRYFDKVYSLFFG